MPAPFRLSFALPFEEAIAQAQARGSIARLPSVYYSDVYADMRRAAFTVSYLSGLDQIREVHDSLQQALRKGESFAEWKRKAELTDWGLKPGHLETVFRTNVQTAYAQGHWRQFLETKSFRPFLMYSAINDSRTRPNHRAMDGYVAHISDPIWKAWTPPCGYNCRCTLISLNEKQALARGLGKRQAPAVKPDAGFGGGDPEALVLSNLDQVTRDRLSKVDTLLLAKIPPPPPPKPKAPPPGPSPAPVMPAAPLWDPLSPPGQWHEKIFKTAPDDLKLAVSYATPKLHGIVKGSGGKYQSWQRTIMMAEKASSYAAGAGRAEYTWAHEFGHFLDDAITGPMRGMPYKGRSHAADFKDALTLDARDIIAKAKGSAAPALSSAFKARAVKDVPGGGTIIDRKMINDRWKALGIERGHVAAELAKHSKLRYASPDARDIVEARIECEMIVALEQGDAQHFLDALMDRGPVASSTGRIGVSSMLSDMIGSATLNKVGGRHFQNWGHSDGYYKKHGYGPDEVYANFTATYATNAPLWHLFAERLFPRSWALFRKDIADVAALKLRGPLPSP